MSEISVEVGNRIRHFRKGRGMTLEELASAIHKSKATLSKYENGDISIDLDTLDELACALQIQIEQLLPVHGAQVAVSQHEVDPTFFRGLKRFYAYYFDGRNGRINRSVFDVFSQTGVNRYKLAMYMNYTDLNCYQQAENTYWGYIEHFDALSHMELIHQSNPMEKASIQVMASFLDAPFKWALWNGLSSRPMMPVALKMLISKKPLKEDAELSLSLKLSKADIRLMKHYNFFTVI